ncbi:MAG: site-specific integrase [Candidatus Sulfotelmatobacter sp.]
MAEQQHQVGYIYEAFNAFHVRYYATENRDGKLVRVQKSHKLCRKDEKKYKSATCRAVKNLCEDFMKDKVNAPSRVITDVDVKIAEFWTNTYLPRVETRLKPSTIRGYKQIWKQHLKDHFADLTLQGYEGKLGQRFLKSLADTQKQNRNTLKHVKALASSIFTTAVEQEIISSNPWRDVVMPRDAKAPERTKHYTLEDAENMISALVDHVEAQLVLALACFLGLGPAEIAGLRWGDVEKDWIHIRRNRVRGEVVTPKTPERMAAVPIIDQVRVPLELWRKKSQSTDEASWVIADLPNLINRVIIPHVEGLNKCWTCEKTPKKSDVKWVGLYAGRRGACTAVVEATNGNYAVAQALLRHKTMTTTLNVYKKAITQGAFQAGMKQLEKTLSK